MLFQPLQIRVSSWLAGTAASHTHKHPISNFLMHQSDVISQICFYNCPVGAVVTVSESESESQQEDDENSSLAPSRKRASSVSAKPAPPSTEEEVTPAAPPGPSSTASPSTVAAVPDSPPVSSTLQPCAKSLESPSESLDASQPPPLPSTSS